MLKLAGLILLVLLILVGALMPLKYTARMQLPRRRATPPPESRNGASNSPAADGRTD